MSIQFDSLEEALSTGFRRPRSVDRDISDFNSYGYKYEDSEGNQTVTVYFKNESNSMGRPGAYEELFLY